MGLIIQNEKKYRPLMVPPPLPYIVYADCKNKASITTSTFTATEDGAYQVYVFWTNGGATGALTDISVKVNDVAVTLTFDDSTVDSKPFAYGELTLSAGDVLTVSNTAAESNRGFQVFVLKNANISNFQVLGNSGNDGSTFPIGHGNYVLECYQYSFYNGTTRYNYMIVADVTTSIATPGGSSTYYYGGTWAIRL